MDIKKMSITDLYFLHRFSKEQKQPDFAHMITIEYERRKKAILSYKAPKKEERSSDVQFVEELLAYFTRCRQKFNLGFRELKVTYDRKRNIIDRRNEGGHTMAEMKATVLSRFLVWGDDESNKQYLVPETIFRPTNWQRYFTTSETILRDRKEYSQNSTWIK